MKITESISVLHIGHTSKKIQDPINNDRYQILDYLIDFSNNSGAVAIVPKEKVLCLNKSTCIEYKIMPENNEQHFEVTLPQNKNNPVMVISLGRRSNNCLKGNNVNFDGYEPQVIFNGLIGEAPTITYSSFGITKGNNDVFDFMLEASFSAPASFNSITILANYPARNFDTKQEDTYSLFSSTYKKVTALVAYQSEQNLTENIVSIANGKNPEPTNCIAINMQVNNLKNKINHLENEIVTIQGLLPASMPDALGDLQNKIVQNIQQITLLNKQITDLIAANPTCF